MLLTGCLASCQAASPYNQKHPQCQGVCLLEGANLLCLQPFGTFTDLKFNLLIFHQGAETAALDLGVVDENVVGAVGWRDEAEALLSVEPLHSSLCHTFKTFSCYRTLRLEYWVDNQPRPSVSRFGDTAIVLSQFHRLFTEMNRFFGEEIASLITERHQGTCTHMVTLPARPARYAEWPEWAVVRDVDKLYEHQAEAAQRAWNGEHVVLATGTSSGKSLAYQLPVITTLLNDPTACALYITPTKALGSDQLTSIRHDVQAAPYDGDTPIDARRHIRDAARWVFTNPDMLHTILLNHKQWQRLFRHLTYVVVDECHAYRGVFGAHVALVLRRLRRIAAHYGSHPTFFFASATSADPAAHASRLLGLPVTAVTDDASPTGARTIMLWQPDKSAVADAAGFMATSIAEGARTLGFVRSRRQAEIVALRCAEELAMMGRIDLSHRVASYRSGYLAEDRRKLERMLDSGELLGVASTNALELGIDVGGLDTVIISGYPGTVASFWQQAGRAGRRGQGALAAFIARDDPLDTYLVHHPEALLDRPLEQHVFDPTNPFVLRTHMLAAAVEIPLTDEDIAEFHAEKVVEELVAEKLMRHRKRWYAMEAPATLRGGSEVSIVDSTDGRLLGTIDRARAMTQTHPGAVYLHQGESFVIDSLDDDLALAHPEEPEWTTYARTTKNIRILDEVSDWVSNVDVEVTEQVIGYTRDSEIIPLDMPPQVLKTRAVVFTAHGSPGALHAAEHAAIGLLPLFATCDRWDLGGLSTVYEGMPTIFIYDGQGGAGFVDCGFRRFKEWMTATYETIRLCECESGCPSCVQSPKCGNGNEPLDKAGALELLADVIKRLG